VSTAIGIAVFLGMMAINRRMRMGAIVVAASALGAAAYVLLSFSGEMTLVRLAELAADSGGRSVVQDLTAQAIGDAPITGTGLGTYGEVFQIYRDGRFGPQTPSYDKAHNTYLEFALEAGLPAFAAMMLVLGGIAALCLRGVLRRRRNVIYPAAGVAATALIGAHSAIDFPLQIPAIAVTYMLLMGTAYAQSWSRRSDGGLHHGGEPQDVDTP
jgi:O-antigen ligase